MFLVFKEVPIPSPVPSFVPVPFPESQKDYEFKLRPLPLRTVAAATLTVVCVSGVLYIATQTGAIALLPEFIRIVSSGGEVVYA